MGAGTAMALRDPMRTRQTKARGSRNSDGIGLKQAPRMRLTARAAGVAVLCAPWAFGALAQERSGHNVGVNVGATWSDNVARATDAQQAKEDGWLDVGLLADLRRESQRFEGTLDANVGYRWYTDSSI